MKYLLILALLPISISAWAAEVSRIVIVDHGVYTADAESAQRNADGILDGSVVNVRLAETTTTVRAQLGVSFGFRYSVDGNPAGAKVTLTKIYIYPSAGVRPPQATEPIHQLVESFVVWIGPTSYSGYTFDDPWELVPGPWTIEIWDGTRKLASQHFDVVKQ